MADERITCRTPTPGKQPCAIPRWKFDAVRGAILDSVPANADGLRASELPERVRAALDADTLEELGSVNWHTTTVRLELEVAGELTRLSGSGPVRVARARPR
ncbi:MAG: hypothetical protein AAFZ58_01825 [Pseudomonadota bacterium]